MERLPGMGAVFDERHNPVFRLGISGDAAMALLAFWQKVNPDSGLLAHDFTDPAWGTRFLGDLYQDLSEATRKRYALLQTPEFVEEFILDRTLGPALDSFGYREVRLIDPTCGSGHFLLGAFQRLLDVWARNEPARNPRDTVQRALDGVYGIDLNPYAVAIARFRLLLAALKACDIERLSEAPAFQHPPRHRRQPAARPPLRRTGPRRRAPGRRAPRLCPRLRHRGPGRGQRHPRPPVPRRGGQPALHHRQGPGPECRLPGALLQLPHEVLPGRALHPALLRAACPLALRERGRSEGSDRRRRLRRPDHRQLLHEAGVRQEADRGIPARLSTSPTSSTPPAPTSRATAPPPSSCSAATARPLGETVRTVMGIKGEPATPADPAQGLVWRAIVEQVDRAGSESAYVSVADTPRATFAKHPWSIGGGGAAELKELIEERTQKLSRTCRIVGIGVRYLAKTKRSSSGTALQYGAGFADS